MYECMNTYIYVYECIYIYIYMHAHAYKARKAFIWYTPLLF